MLDEKGGRNTGEGGYVLFLSDLWYLLVKPGFKDIGKYLLNRRDSYDNADEELKWNERILERYSGYGRGLTDAGDDNMSLLSIIRDVCALSARNAKITLDKLDRQ